MKPEISIVMPGVPAGKDFALENAGCKKYSVKTELPILFTLYLLALLPRIFPVKAPGYLVDSDCYFYLRLSANLIRNGFPGDLIENRTVFDFHRYAPDGIPVPSTLALVYLTVFLWRFLNLFSAFSLETIAYYLPAFFGALTVVPAYLFVRDRTGRAGGIVSAILVSSSFRYVIRTVPGFYDTDLFQAVLPLFLFYFLLKALPLSKKAVQTTPPSTEEKEKGRNRRILFGALSLLTLFLFSRSWDGWLFYAGILGIFLCLYLFFVLRARIPALILTSAGLILLFLPSVGVLNGFLSFSGISGLTSDGFPAVFQSISEMQRSPVLSGGFRSLYQICTYPDNMALNGVLNGTGGLIAILFALAELFLLLKSKEKSSLTDGLLFLPWFLLSAFLAFRKGRFIVLLLLPVSLLAGMFLKPAAAFLSLQLSRTGLSRGGLSQTGLSQTGPSQTGPSQAGLSQTGLSQTGKAGRGNHFGPAFCTAFLALLLAVPSYYGGVETAAAPRASVMTPSVDSSLQWIRQNTADNTIVASWWDYGYPIEQISDRATFSDGGMQVSERIFLLAGMLSTEDPVLSGNIIKMLSGSGNRALEKAAVLSGSMKKGSALLLRILSASPDNGKKLLMAETSCTEDDADALLSLAFPAQSRPAVLFLTPDLTGKQYWISFFANGYENAEKPKGYFSPAAQLLSLPENGKGTCRFDLQDGTRLNAFVGRGSGNTFLAYTQHTDKNNRPMEKAGFESSYPLKQITVYSLDGTEKSTQILSSEKPGSILILKERKNGIYEAWITDRLPDSLLMRLTLAEGKGQTAFTELCRSEDGCSVWRVN